MIPGLQRAGAKCSNAYDALVDHAHTAAKTALDSRAQLTGRTRWIDSTRAEEGTEVTQRTQRNVATAWEADEMRSSIWRWAAAVGLAVASSETISYAQYVETAYNAPHETVATLPQSLQPVPVIPAGYEAVDEKVPQGKKKSVVPDMRRTPAPPPPPINLGPRENVPSAPYPATTEPKSFGFSADTYGQPAADASCGVYADNGNSVCGSSGGCWDALVSEPCPRFNLQVWSGYESFRGIADGAGNNNNGGVSGFNAGAPIPLLDQLGIGAQFGASSGTYDLMGRPTFESNRWQQQYFVTAGLFRRATECSPWSFGLAYDWSINDNFGAFSDEPFLSQWRAQAGYALNATDEVGVWGTWIDRTDTSAGVRTYRPVSQINLYWHHKYTCLNADTWTWIGQPSNGTRGGNGTYGEFVVGTNNQIAISDRLAVYINAALLKPSANAGGAGSAELGYQLAAGFVFYPTCGARSCSVAGRKWMPLMPVANNGTFWIDQF